ncbi:UNVERIFIED_ORG: hypothetical protein E4P37_07530 [Bacillus sp. AZ43]
MTRDTSSVVEAVVDRPADEKAGDRSPGEGASGDRILRWTASLTGRRLTVAALVLIGLQLLLRGWVAANSYFRQDDLIVSGLAARRPLFSADFLLYDHDGHFMPAGFLLTGLLSRLAPLEWWVMLVTLVALAAVASLAVWRLLRILLGDRPVLLVPLLLYLFSPLSLPAFAWFIAGANALPLQAGLAWVVGDAVLLARTGRVRYAVTGTLAFAVTLTFFEKSLVIPLVAAAVLVVLLRTAGAATPIVAALREGRWLWVGCTLVVAGWFAVYATVVGSPAIDERDAGTVPQAVDLIGGGWLEGLVPGLIGGPLTWADPGLWATPAPSIVVVGCVAIACAIVWTSRHRRGAGVIWWLFAAYLVINAAAMITGRLTEATPTLLSLSLRYYAEAPLVAALVLALLILAPTRTDFRRRPVLTPAGRRAAGIGAAAAFLVASLWSTASFTRVMADSSTDDYLANARASFEQVGDAPLLDQSVPDSVVWAPAHPYNMATHVFAPLGHEAPFASSTPELRLLDTSGQLVDGRIDALRGLLPGPLAGCGYGVTAGRTTTVPLDGPLVSLPWTVQLNYLAGDDGVVEVSLDGRTVRVPVERGPNTAFVRLTGGGDELRLRGVTAGVGVCVDSGQVGFVRPVD